MCDISTDEGIQWMLEDLPQNLTSGPTASMLTFMLVAKIIDLQQLQADKGGPYRCYISDMAEQLTATAPQTSS
jgi:hypothetical protein